MTGEDLRLLVLHGLRLAGFATSESVAAMYDLDPAAVRDELACLLAEGLVTTARVEGGRSALSDAGRRHGEELLARQLDGATTATGESAQPIVDDAYRRFVELNQPFLDVCTRWQIVDQDPVMLNDHDDPVYDAAVLERLGEIDTRIEPICAQLESVLGRFGRYRQGLTQALLRLRQGETEWLTKPTIMSYHTLWFQLHEDLLATLGLERAAETASLNDNPTAEPRRPR